jgi:hypothetical protein
MTVADPVPEERALASAEELVEVHSLTELRRLRDVAYALKDEDARELLQAACDLADGQSLIDAIAADRVAERREQIRLAREAERARQEELTRQAEDLPVNPPEERREPEEGAVEAVAPFGAFSRSDDLGG